MDVKLSLNNYYNFFKLMEEMIDCINDDIDKINFIEDVYSYFYIKHPGVFYSRKFERVLIDIASSIEWEASKTYKSNSFLHVLSVPYETGGHTRVVERWIKYSNNSSVHSVAVTMGGYEIAKKLFEDIVSDKNGKVYLLEEVNQIEKAKNLRKLASHYEYIILHHHMQDSIPLLAFGVEDFERPVIVYDHAQHCLWLGASITDHLLALSTSIIDFIKIKRKINYVSVVGIPLENKIIKEKDNSKKNEIKKKLGIRLDAKVILSIGSEYKYSGLDFINYIENVLSITDKNVIFIIIGPSINNISWKSLKDRFPERVYVLGQVENKFIYDYYDVADLYVDSYPVPGGTAFNDAVTRKINAIALKGGYFDIDIKKYFELSFDNWVQRTIELLKEESFIFNNAIEELNNLIPETWASIVYNKIKQGPRKHKINDDVYKNGSEDIHFQPYDYFWHKQNLILKENGVISDSIDFIFKYTEKYPNLDKVVEYYFKVIKGYSSINYKKYYIIFKIKKIAIKTGLIHVLKFIIKIFKSLKKLLKGNK